MINIYIDMDGVVCNFEQGFHAVYGEWSHEHVEDFLSQKGFENLQPYQGVYQLHNMLVELTNPIYKGLINIEFLSSMGNHYNPEIYHQKRKWLNKFGFENVRLITVYHKGLKKRFASPSSLLLDDTKQNIYDFSEEHGHAMLIDKKVGITNKNMEDVIDWIINQLKTNEYGIPRHLNVSV